MASKAMTEILCMLVEKFADAADIDLDATCIELTADGKPLGSKFVSEILRDVRTQDASHE